MGKMGLRLFGKDPYTGVVMAYLPSSANEGSPPLWHIRYKAAAATTAVNLDKQRNDNNDDDDDGDWKNDEDFDNDSGSDSEDLDERYEKT